MPTPTPKASHLASATARCATLAAALFLLAAAVGASEAHALNAAYEGASADGSEVFFSTEDKLVPGDTDTRRDIYLRTYDAGEAAYVTRLVSTGPIGGNGTYPAEFGKVSADGTKVFFSTREKLTPTDTDGQVDVYVRNPGEGTTALVSLAAEACGGSCGNGPAEATFVGASGNGTVAFFVTSERLAPGDTDGAVDVYARDLSLGVTSLVSAGGDCAGEGCGNEGVIANLRGASPDGSKAFIATFEPLTKDDTDNDIDLYSRELPNGPTVRVSQGAAECAPSCGNGSSLPAEFAATSSDGSKVYFETSEGLVSGDTDGSHDVYLRSGGTTSLVTAGSATKPANLEAVSSNGGQALFITAEGLVGGDTNSANDVYKWSGGAPALVTSGTCTQGSGCGVSFNSATEDAALLFFTTTEELAAGDTDSSPDVYRVSTSGGATPVLVSAGGNGAFPAKFQGSSTNGGMAYFSTAEALLPQDEDALQDLYLRDLGGSTTSLSTPPGTCPNGADCNITYHSNSTDAKHVFFVTQERLTGEDVDSETDVYERDSAVEPAETRLVSRGNSGDFGPATPVLTATSPASPGSSTTPAILGQADPESSIKIYTTFDCSGTPVATGTSAELESGIAVTVTAGSTTSFRATATDGEGDTSQCSLAISYTQGEGSPPPPPPPPPPPGEEGGGGSGGGGSGSGGSGGNDGKPKFYGGGIPFVTPVTQITFGPAFKTRKRKAVFRFIDSTGQPGTKFICKLQRKLRRRRGKRWTKSRWGGCASPKKVKRLRGGKYRFMVKGQNAAGTWEEKPVKRAFKVVRGRRR